MPSHPLYRLKRYPLTIRGPLTSVVRANHHLSNDSRRARDPKKNGTPILGGPNDRPLRSKK